MLGCSFRSPSPSTWGLCELVYNHVDLGDAAGRSIRGDKMLTLVASALSGGDCIDDADMLRTGGTARTLGCVVKALSTPGHLSAQLTVGACPPAGLGGPGVAGPLDGAHRLGRVSANHQDSHLWRGYHTLCPAGLKRIKATPLLSGSSHHLLPRGGQILSVDLGVKGHCHCPNAARRSRLRQPPLPFQPLIRIVSGTTRQDTAGSLPQEAVAPSSIRRAGALGTLFTE